MSRKKQLAQWHTLDKAQRQAYNKLWAKKRKSELQLKLDALKERIKTTYNIKDKDFDEDMGRIKRAYGLTGHPKQKNIKACRIMEEEQKQAAEQARAAAAQAAGGAGSAGLLGHCHYCACHACAPP